MTRKEVFVIFWLTLAVGYNYARDIFGPHASECIARQESIVNHTADSPYSYRVLVPELTHTTAIALNLVLRRQHLADVAAYVIFILLAIAFSFSMLYLLMRRDFPKASAILGLIVIGISMIISYQDNQPWSLLDPGFYALAVLGWRTGRRWELIPLIAVATLNRETAIFLVVLLGSMAFRQEPRHRIAGWFLVYGLVWAAVYGALRLSIGSHPHEQTISTYVRYNVAPRGLALSAFNIFIFLGPFWFAVWRGLRVAPAFQRYGFIGFVLFVIGASPWSLWWEVRLWTPFYCVLIPLMLYGLKSAFGETLFNLVADLNEVPVKAAQFS